MSTTDSVLSTTAQLTGLHKEAQFRRVMAAGMGPLLLHAVGDRGMALPAEWRDALHGADLTARARHGARVDTALEVIDECARLGVQPTLLKGISITEQFYPEAHLRPMGDVDILVPPDACNAVESALIELDYFPQPGFKLDESSKHGVPLQHPRTGIWVEIHSALFPGNSRLGSAGIFARNALGCAPSVASEFHERPVRRFADEMQLLYLASSWVQDLSEHGFDPTLLISLFDAVYLLRGSPEGLDWDGLLGWADNETALASLDLIVTYLGRHELFVPSPEFLSRLGSNQRIIGPIELWMLHAMLDRYLLWGKPFTRVFHSARVWETLFGPGRGPAKLARLPWGIVFPPNSPERFTLRYQIERVPRLLRRLGIMTDTTTTGS